MSHKTSWELLDEVTLMCLFFYISLLKLQQLNPLDIIQVLLFLLVFFEFSFLSSPAWAAGWLGGFVHTNIRRRDAWPPFGFRDASHIYDVPMVKDEAIVVYLMLLILFQRRNILFSWRLFLYLFDFQFWVLSAATFDSRLPDLIVNIWRSLAQDFDIKPLK